MDYGCSSGANEGKVAAAFRNKFGYGNNADYRHRDGLGHTDSTWKGWIKLDLNWGFPILYGGYRTVFGADGHAFVCDGYRNDDYFHFNWGWRGKNNDWFTLDNLKPGDHSYNCYQYAIFQIYPNYYQEYCNFEPSLGEFYEQSYHPGYAYSFSETTHPPYSITPKTMTTLKSVTPAEAQTLLGGSSSWYTIPSGATAEYVAHESIVLRPGFHAKQGSTFTARIEPCTNCPSTRVAGYNSNEENVEEDIEIFEDNNSENNYDELNNTLADAGITVYPNPTTGIINIHFDNLLSEQGTIEVRNAYNTTVALITNQLQAVTTVNIFGQPMGFYYVIIRQGEKVYSLKIMKS
jgi:hypothetical protein